MFDLRKSSRGPRYLVILCAALIAGCSGAPEESGNPAPKLSVSPPGVENPTPTPLKPDPVPYGSPSIGLTPGTATSLPKKNLHPIVIIKTSLGDVTVELDAEKAPLTVDNFLENYVDRGFYDQTIVHYVDDGSMVAAGGFTADFEPKTPRAEILNEADNGLKNQRYTVAMARHPEYVNSATSQFFINLADNAFLDHQSDESAETYGYCVFGKVTRGQEIVDRIAKVAVRDTETFPKTPTEPITIHTVVRIE